MADHYVAIDRGNDGTKISDLTFGTSSASSKHVELRIKDGVGLTRREIVLALEAFERAMLSGAIFTTVPPL